MQSQCQEISSAMGCLLTEILLHLMWCYHSGLGLMDLKPSGVLAHLVTLASYFWCHPCRCGLGEPSPKPHPTCLNPGPYCVFVLVSPSSFLPLETLGVLLSVVIRSLFGAILQVLYKRLLASCTHARLSWRSVVSPASLIFLSCHPAFHLAWSRCCQTAPNLHRVFRLQPPPFS